MEKLTRQFNGQTLEFTRPIISEKQEEPLPLGAEEYEPPELTVYGVIKPFTCYEGLIDKIQNINQEPEAKSIFSTM